MHDDLLQPLKEWWMSEKEAKIYLATLELGSAPASTIARKSGIKRVTTYALLRDFQNRSIASSVEKGGITYFQVITPTQLLAKLKQLHDTFAEKVPELMAVVHSFTTKPRIQYYEGITGVKEMYEDLLTSTEPIHAFLGMQSLDEQLEAYLYDDFLPRRIAHKIPAKVLVPADTRTKHYAKVDKKYLKETRIIHDPVFMLTTEINLYGPWKVAIALFSPDEMSALVIHSHRLYESLQGIFSLLRTHADGDL